MDGYEYSEFGWTYLGLNITSSLGQIAGRAYSLCTTREIRLSHDGMNIKGYRYRDLKGNLLLGVNLANKNPYRYRGYRYDKETNYYYLNSRYYNPELGRFINADGLIGEVGGILGHNMYAYAMNNPVMYADPSGYLLFPFMTPEEYLYLMTKDIRDTWNYVTYKVEEKINEASNWTKNAGKAVGEFAVNRFSTPEKTSNTLSAIGWTLDTGAAYCAGVAAGLAIPTLGMSVVTAGTTAAVLGLISIPFHGAALIIDIVNEE